MTKKTDIYDQFMMQQQKNIVCPESAFLHRVSVCQGFLPRQRCIIFARITKPLLILVFVFILIVLRGRLICIILIERVAQLPVDVCPLRLC
jgi:hypothetical protein